VEAPSVSSVKVAKQKIANGDMSEAKSERTKPKGEKEEKAAASTTPIAETKKAKKAGASREGAKDTVQATATENAQKDRAKEVKAKISVIEEKVAKSKQSESDTESDNREQIWLYSATDSSMGGIRIASLETAERREYLCRRS
jgi:hypothetical protein